MGKKKRFIDKKNAVSFRLVHRSQRDPLQADEESSKHVLLPMNDDANQTSEDRKKQQRSYGVFYDDEYDYLQHLKQRTDTSLEPLPGNVTVIEAKKTDVKKFGKVTLPSEVFASGHEENEGLLNLAASVSGPRPDWDPDIVAALDDALDLNDPDNVLDDDFILKANESFENTSDNDNNHESYHEEIDEDYISSDDDHNSWDFGDEDDDDEMQSKFSNYSMTSSVIRRTQGLCLLDDRFNKIMEEYEDDEIGALDHEEVGGNRNLNDPLLESIKNEIMGKDESEPLNITRSRVKFDVDEKRISSSEEDGFMKIEEHPKEQWDCESILSTYSNLYNHPSLITESTKPKDFSEKRISLSKREGIPLGVLSDGSTTSQDPEKSKQSRVNHVRLRGESSEEKKARKQLVKQERQTRRAEKKTNKLLFKEERKRQEKSNSGLIMGQKIQ